MLRVPVLFFCVVVCQGHAVLPIVVPTVHLTPLSHSYGIHGFAEHGILQHGWLHKPVHHFVKRSPHLVPLDHGTQLGHHIGAVAPAAHITPLAISHHSRLDVHTSPALVAAPILPVVKSVSVPLLHKSFLAAPYHYGIGHYNHHILPHHLH